MIYDRITEARARLAVQADDEQRDERIDPRYAGRADRMPRLRADPIFADHCAALDRRVRALQAWLSRCDARERGCATGVFDVSAPALAALESLAIDGSERLRQIAP